MNALWDRWRKKLQTDSVPARAGDNGPRSTLIRDLREALGPVIRPCAAIRLAGAAESPTQSYLSGHPYLPKGETWPRKKAGPQIFLGQFNFAEVGALPGFPTTGLLQWFVDADDTYGLRFGESRRAVGVTIRWYAEPAAAGSPPPDTPTPTDSVEDLPMEFIGPTALSFRPAASVPAWDRLPEDLRLDPIWTRLAASMEERRTDDPEFLYEQYVRGGSSVLSDLRAASKIGGYPTFTQWDPRGIGGYPTIDSGRAELIVELDSIDVGGWGDSGIAHLFGAPAALAAGDAKSIRYHWDCL